MRSIICWEINSKVNTFSCLWLRECCWSRGTLYGKHSHFVLFLTPGCNPHRRWLVASDSQELFSHACLQVLKPGAKIMMMGTPEAVTAALDAQAEVAPHVQDDFNVAAGVLDDATDFVDREENQVPCFEAVPLLDRRSASTA